MFSSLHNSIILHPLLPSSSLITVFNIFIPLSFFFTGSQFSILSLSFSSSLSLSSLALSLPALLHLITGSQEVQKANIWIRFSFPLSLFFAHIRSLLQHPHHVHLYFSLPAKPLRSYFISSYISALSILFLWLARGSGKCIAVSE